MLCITDHCSFHNDVLILLSGLDQGREVDEYSLALDPQPRQLAPLLVQICSEFRTKLLYLADKIELFGGGLVLEALGDQPGLNNLLVVIFFHPFFIEDEFLSFESLIELLLPEA
jgi:hypothetical protein